MRIQIRRATSDDAAAVAKLAAELAQSFAFSQEKFEVSYPSLVEAEDARLLLATIGGDPIGYLLGFRHLTFYANGPVGWVEEIGVGSGHRGHGVGRVLMAAFEQWAAGHDCTLVALATRRAVPFYRALGYEESAVYLRKILLSPGSRSRVRRPVASKLAGEQPSAMVRSSRDRARRRYGFDPASRAGRTPG
jgi:GNAT superfamily N-acetyltransferase